MTYFAFTVLNLRAVIENTLSQIEKKYPINKTIRVKIDELFEVRADEDSLEKSYLT